MTNLSSAPAAPKAKTSNPASTTKPLAILFVSMRKSISADASLKTTLPAPSAGVPATINSAADPAIRALSFTSESSSPLSVSVIIASSSAMVATLPSSSSA